MFHIDLKKAYYHIALCRGHQEYMGFNYVDRRAGITRHIRMIGLPMGLNPPTEIFTSWDKPFVTELRSELVAVVYPFLDDLSGTKGSPVE